ncbi:MAG: phage holin family protein [Firmicutes bacterium]|nr:phage holin family protein [Bacillota bacterium]
MRGLLYRWIVNALALFLTQYVVDGVQLEGFAAPLIAAAVLGVVNALIRPFLVLLTLPLNILTLGLFTLVINGFMLYIVSRAVAGFEIVGFWPAIFGALILSVISSIISFIAPDKWARE